LVTHIILTILVNKNIYMFSGSNLCSRLSYHFDNR
jgi:hypothetical protein